MVSAILVLHFKLLSATSGWHLNLRLFLVQHALISFMPACCCRDGPVFAESHGCQADLLNLRLLDAREFLQILGHIENNRLTCFKACWTRVWHVLKNWGKNINFDCLHSYVSQHITMAVVLFIVRACSEQNLGCLCFVCSHSVCQLLIYNHHALWSVAC